MWLFASELHTRVNWQLSILLRLRQGPTENLCHLPDTNIVALAEVKDFQYNGWDAWQGSAGFQLGLKRFWQRNHEYVHI